MTRAPKSSPRVEKAQKVYKDWHQKDPQKVTKKKRSIPDKMYKVGVAKEILYQSKKWESKNFDYIHNHDSRPPVYCEYEIEDTRSNPTHATTTLLGCSSLAQIPLVHLGEVLEYCIELPNGEEYVMPLSGKPMLCSTEDEKAIVILDRGGLIVVRGGSMRVDSRGIID